jgi:outer membrane protein
MMPIFAQAEENSTSTDIKIAVVDIQQLMGASKAAKSIQSQGKSLRDKYQKEIKKIEDDLKATEKKLVELSQGDSKKDFDDQKEKFQKKLVDGQKEVRELNQKLDKSLGDALNKLRDEIVEIVGNMATDRGYDLVISRADVVIVSKKIDITAEVMKELNKNLSTVKVKG